MLYGLLNINPGPAPDLTPVQGAEVCLCVGGRGMRMLNNATGEVICQSDTTYGSGPRGASANGPVKGSDAQMQTCSGA